MSDEPTDRDVEALARIIYEAASDADTPWDLMLASGQATLYLIQARHIITSDWYAEHIAQARREGAADLRARVEAAYDDAVVLKGPDGIPYWAIHRHRLRDAVRGDA